MDALLAECVAHPDDDGPRLVWADAIGGERGELVTLQCDLARGGLAPRDRELRVRRERDLLDRHAVAWAGELAALADRWSFRRGFVETASVRYAPASELARVRAAAPLLGTLMLDGKHDGFVAPAQLEQLRGLRGLGLVGDAIGARFAELAPVLGTFGLRALALDGLDAQMLRPLGALLDASPIETLVLRDLRLTARELERLLRHVPKLRALALDPVTAHHQLLAVVAQRPLQALRIEHVTTAALHSLTGTPLAGALERLGFHAQGMPMLPELPRLVHCEPLEDELLHHDPGALLTLGAARYRASPACVLRELASDRLHELPEGRASTVWSFGRATDNDVVLAGPQIARRHARLAWNGSHHVIDDLDTVNGVFVNGERVESKPLQDGDEVALAELRFRYFVGAGARERAVAWRATGVRA